MIFCNYYLAHWKYLFAIFNNPETNKNKSDGEENIFHVRNWQKEDSNRELQ